MRPIDRRKVRGAPVAAMVCGLLAALLTAACNADDLPALPTGPGGGTPPTAAAGYDDFATLGAAYSLGACPSSGTAPLSYAWSLDSDGCSAGALTGAGTATPSLTPTAYGACAISLVVTDGDGLSSTADTVSITGVLQAVTDTTAGGATVDGTVNGGEYGGSSQGINASFGNVIGSASKLHVEADSAGIVQLGLESGGGSLNDVVVLYVDSVSGGFTDTTGFTDIADPHRSAISGTNGTDRNDLVFPAGFEADFALAFDSSFAGLWQLQIGSHVFVNTLTFMPTAAATAGAWELELALSDLGLAVGDPFDYVVTYVNVVSAVRSDEFHGVAQATIPAGNITAGSTTTLGNNDFARFDSSATCP